MAAKFELERFDGKGDFGLWKTKMKALLVQQKVAKALLDPSKLPQSLSDSEKEEMQEIAHSLIILHLADNVLRRVSKIEKADALWAKLDELYMPKTLTNKLYLKEQFLVFRMDSSKNLEENLDEYSRICTELENASETVSDDDQAVILLNSLPKSFKQVKAAIKYGRDKMSLDRILDALRLKDLELKKEKKESEAFFVKESQRQHNKGKNSQNKGQNFQNRGQNKHRENKNSGRHQNSSKPPDKSTVKCNYCHKTGHIRRDCYQLKRKNSKQT